MRKHFSFFHLSRFLAPLFSAAIILLPIAGSFIPNEADAAPRCGRFDGATYRIINNGGSSNYDYGERIETRLSLFTAATGEQYHPTDIVLMMDRTGSMNHSGKMWAAKTALKNVVDQVANSGNPYARIAFGYFNISSTIAVGFTRDWGALKVAIDGMDPIDGTSIGAGLTAAGSILPSDSGGKKRFVVIASDGQHNTAPSIAEGLSRIPSDVMIYSIGIGDVYEPEMRQIAEEGGSKNGLYFRATSQNLSQTFSNIMDQIMGYFIIENISVSFTRDDALYTSFIDSNPVYSSYNPTSKRIRWDNLGNMTNDRRKDLQLNYGTERVGTDIPLNTRSLVVSYVNEGRTCNDTIPVNVLSVVIFNNPVLCDDHDWLDDPTNLVRCDTIMFQQTSACGNHRMVRGEINCPECSDYIDNDRDRKIDYPLDLGCKNALDDRELNFLFNIFEF
ncbi:MAG: vWA domain-containing protein [Candidatus Paceibacterota bacterium]|jgi:hypothetical protein|nr:VWA domain-containing protein [Candidatus Paceibacterota bacterium]